MITSPESNVKYTDEQTAAIKQVESKLFLLQNEISIANESIFALKGEVKSLEKEREYQQELIEKLSAQVSEKTKEKETLDVSVSTLKDYIESETNILVTRKQEISNKEIKLTEREQSLKEKEEMIESDASILKEQIVNLESEKREVEIASKAFVEAAELVTWKYNKVLQA